MNSLWTFRQFDENLSVPYFCHILTAIIKTYAKFCIWNRDLSLQQKFFQSSLSIAQFQPLQISVLCYEFLNSHHLLIFLDFWIIYRNLQSRVWEIKLIISRTSYRPQKRITWKTLNFRKSDKVWPISHASLYVVP